MQGDTLVNCPDYKGSILEHFRTAWLNGATDNDYSALYNCPLFPPEGQQGQEGFRRHIIDEQENDDRKEKG